MTKNKNATPEEVVSFSSLPAFYDWSKDNRKIIPLNMEFLELFPKNNYVRGLILSQLDYFFRPPNNGKSAIRASVFHKGKHWFATRGQKVWADELGTSEDTVQRQLDILESKELIVRECFKSQFGYCIHISLNSDVLLDMINQNLLDNIKKNPQIADTLDNLEYETSADCGQKDLQIADYSLRKMPPNLYYCNNSNKAIPKEKYYNQSYQQPPPSLCSPQGDISSDVPTATDCIYAPTEEDLKWHDEDMLAEVEENAYPDDVEIEEEPVFLKHQDSMRILKECEAMVKNQQFKSDEEYEEFKIQLIQKALDDDIPF